MADNQTIQNDGAPFTVVADEITSPYTGGSAKAEAVKLLGGAANNAEPIDGTTANGLDVDVTRVPADPFGANADAAATAGSTGSIQAKLRLITSQLDAVKTAVELIDNAISGTEMQVDVLSLPAAEHDTDSIAAVLAPLAAPPTGFTALSSIKILSAASTNATSVKASAGQVYWLVVTNTNASPRYLKLYNKASAPTVGTDTPVHTFLIPGDSGGRGFAIPLPVPITFATGIALALTTGAADADTGAVAANEIIVNGGYR